MPRASYQCSKVGSEVIVDRPQILEANIERMADYLRVILAGKPKLTQKEELEERKKEVEAQAELEKNKNKQRKLADFESFKDEVLEESLIG